NEDVVIIDNFSNSTEDIIKVISKLSGKKIRAYKVDLLDKKELKTIFTNHTFSKVLHFAGLKSVSESVQSPIRYYMNNIVGLLNLLELMKIFHVNKIIFSSSATVYGLPETIPINEKCRIGETTNPYGTSKYYSEVILKDASLANPKLDVIILRYFNPVGAHESGLIGENPRGTPANLVPYMMNVALGKLPALTIYGHDYPTPDGTGIRDYIHVNDLAEGHISAFKMFGKGGNYKIYNLGTGRGYSVLEVIKTFQSIIGKNINYSFGPNRSGDVAECWADVSKAEKELDWKARRDLTEMLSSAWKWHTLNPDGYN
ncbi:UDP-glucose 4-epimerase GalE, partial [Escherichia coli]|nr:UDP-glucose 4-epimerase GalE [Escherichia coli]